jgi:hypothetical protein
MEHYTTDRDVALVLIHWIRIELLKTFKPPYEPIVWGDHMLTFNEFTTIALCNG